MKPFEKMDAGNTALIVIDPVNGCCHEDCEEEGRGITYRKVREMMPKLDRFIGEFRSRIGGKIIFTNLTPWTEEYLPENLNELYRDPAASFYGEGSEFESRFYLVQPKPGDAVITKSNYDTFTNPEFEKLLRNSGIKYLVMTGVFTDGCVLATICGGFARGYHFVILKDLMETSDNPLRQELSQNLVDYTFPFLYGRTMTSEEFLRAW